MALTESTTRQQRTPAQGSSSRRSIVSRLSLGHVVMIVAGLVAILLNLAYLRSSSTAVSVVIARTTLEQGTVLDGTSIATVEVGDAGDLALLTDDVVEGLFGSILARRVNAGDPLRKSDLRPASTHSSLRESSVLLDNSAAAGGLIQPADVVDVIATIDGSSFYVAAGLDVVSVSREGTGREVGDKLIIVLSVDDRTALELASAQAAGSIILVRSTGAAPPVNSAVDLGAP